MVRKSTIIGLLAMLLVSAPVMARKLTTTQMRENTIRINALEIEEEGAEAVKVEPKEEVVVLDAGKLNFDFDKDIVKERYFELLRNVKAYAEQKNYAIRIIGVESMGEREPVATNETEEGRFENRRIEFQFSPFQGQ